MGIVKYRSGLNFFLDSAYMTNTGKIIRALYLIKYVSPEKITPKAIR